MPEAAASPAPRTDETPRLRAVALALALAGSAASRHVPRAPGDGRRRLHGAPRDRAEHVRAPAERRDPECARLDRASRLRLEAIRSSPRPARTRSCSTLWQRGGRGLRRLLAGARRDQQDRVELRPQHGAELRRRDRLDAVHALDLGALGTRRRRRRHREPLEPRGRDLLGGALPGGLRRADRHLPRRSSRTTMPQWYVDEVLQLAQLFNAGGVDVTFNLDRLQVSLEQGTRTWSSQTNRKLVKAAAERTRARPARADAPAPRRRHAPALRSFRARRRAAQAGVVRAAAQARVGRPPRDARAGQRRTSRSARDRSLAIVLRARRRLAARRTVLRRPATSSRSAAARRSSRSRTTTTTIRRPTSPRRRARRSTRSPDAIVVRAWTYPNGQLRDRPRRFAPRTARAGRTATSRTSTRPSPPARRSPAGTQVGLVGSTGHSTGPHLHLQLDPTTSYPQQQAWFQTFAGTAFRWQDGGPTDSVVAAGTPSLRRRTPPDGRIQHRIRSSSSPVKGMTAPRRPAEGMSMAVRLAALLPRALSVALVLGPRRQRLHVCRRHNHHRALERRLRRNRRRRRRAELVVPSVSGQAYVFAKGILEDAGFAWR